MIIKCDKHFIKNTILQIHQEQTLMDSLTKKNIKANDGSISITAINGTIKSPLIN